MTRLPFSTWIVTLIGVSLMVHSGAYAVSQQSEAESTGDMLTLTLDGFGKSTTVGYGYFDIDYLNSNCEQPFDLLMRGFDVAAEFSLFGPVYIFLDTTRVSTGFVKPLWAHYDSVEVGDGDFFPAINKNSFYLMLEIPKTKTRCISMGPVNLEAVVDSWPPPRGTIYRCEEEVKFKSIDSTGEYERLGLTVFLQKTLRASFHGDKHLDVDLRAEGMENGLHKTVATFSSRADSVIECSWRFYSQGKIMELQMPGDTVSHYGKYGGHDSLYPGGSFQQAFYARMLKPGSEKLSVMAGSRIGREDFFGGDKSLRLSLADRGLEADALSPWRLEKGSTTDVLISGKTFREPLDIAVSGEGVSVESVEMLSASELRVRLAVAPAAPGNDRDVVVQSDGRSYTMADVLRILHPAPEVGELSMTDLPTDEAFELTIHGKHFPEPLFVSLGETVNIEEVNRISEREIQVKGRVAEKATGDVDLLVASGAGSVKMQGALRIDAGFSLAFLFSHWYISALIPFVCIVAFVGWKRRRSGTRAATKSGM